MWRAVALLTVGFWSIVFSPSLGSFPTYTHSLECMKTAHRTHRENFFLHFLVKMHRSVETWLQRPHPPALSYKTAWCNNKCTATLLKPKRPNSSQQLYGKNMWESIVKHFKFGDREKVAYNGKMLIFSPLRKERKRLQNFKRIYFSGSRSLRNFVLTLIFINILLITVSCCQYFFIFKIHARLLHMPIQKGQEKAQTSVFLAHKVWDLVDH